MLEPSWTFIDAIYFSMTTLTTIGYGDLVVGSSGIGLRATIAKLFLISFNIYAVCISVSALGIIAKIAMAQEKKILRKARERARDRFVKLWSVDDDDDEEEEEDDEDLTEEDEDCTWVDNIFLDKCDSDKRRTLMGTLWQSIKRHLTNFVALVGIAFMMVRVEKWSLIDILYYWNSTATTIGYGDISPQTQIGRLLAVIFIPLSVISLGEVIAGCVAHLNARAAAKAEKDFLRREVTFNDLEYLDVNDDGKVCMLDFITFMLLAMQKVDKKTMKDLKSLFKALDTQSSGFIEKEDLLVLRQRKRLAKRLRREARNRKKLFDRGYPKGVSEDLQTTKHIYDQLHGIKITSSNS
jgi:voltage-gated potassium channel Kch